MNSTLTPSAKAGAEPLPPGSESCGCCEGVQTATPRLVDNRSGLSAVDYRIGRHGDWQASLTAGLSQGGTPELAPLGALLTRDSRDFTIGLIDAFSCAADVLTFYQERIANESWLRTCTERVSLQEQGRLIGYRLKPGVAAEAWLAFAAETPPAPPAAMKPEPGSFVTGVPEAVTLAAGLRVNSVPGPDEKPQAFETVEPLQAHWQWNAMRALPDEERVPGFGARETWLAGTSTQLKAGDMLVFVGPQFDANPASNRWDRRLLTAVEPDETNQRTRVAWQEPLGSVTPLVRPADPPVVLAMRERAALFGHNAPGWPGMSAEFKAAYLGLPSPSLLEPEDLEEWPDFDIYAPGSKGPSIKARTTALQAAAVQAQALDSLVDPVVGQMVGAAVDLPLQAADAVAAATPARALAGRAGLQVSLDRDYPGIVPGSYVLLDKADYSELFKVGAVAQGSRAEFAISGKSTYLQLTGQNLSLYDSAVRETTVYARSEVLKRARAPIKTPVSGASVQVAADVSAMAAGRRVIVKGQQVKDGSMLVHHATVLSAVPAALAADGGTLLIDPPLPEALQREGTVVYGNVALASHGETVAQILGAGNAAQPFQQFDLKQAPLTYRAAATESGAAPELTVRVGDVAWAERSTLYGAGATERVYALRTDEQGRVFVQFGDGLRGARPPSGVNNIRASYRKGLGVAGNVRAETLTQPSVRPLGLKSVANLAPAEGGTDPEPADAARRSMPLQTRTLGRAVSVLDYEDFARAYAGVAKARAAVLQLASGPTVCVTVAGDGGALLTTSNPLWVNLLAALRASGDPHVPLRLLTHAASTFRLGLKVKVDAAYDSAAVLAVVETALRTHFSFDSREPGQPVQQSEVMAVVHTVPGVVALDLDFLYGGSAPLGQTTKSRQVRLLATRMHVAGGQPRAAEVLTMDPAPFDRLEVMP